MSRCFYLHNEQSRQWIVKVKSLAMTQRPRCEEFQPGLKKALLTPKSLFLPLIHVASQGQDEAGEGSKVRVLCGSAVYSGWKLTHRDAISSVWTPYCSRRSELLRPAPSTFGLDTSLLKEAALCIIGCWEHLGL